MQGMCPRCGGFVALHPYDGLYCINCGWFAVPLRTAAWWAHEGYILGSRKRGSRGPNRVEVREALAMPGRKYRSIKRPRQYEALRRKGYSKAKSARISNASRRKRR